MAAKNKTSDYTVLSPEPQPVNEEVIAVATDDVVEEPTVNTEPDYKYDDRGGRYIDVYDGNGELIRHDYV